MRSRLLVLLLLGGCSRAPAPPPAGPTLAPELEEISGLAASYDHPWLWGLQDSGNEPVLYAFGYDGTTLATVRVAGATNVDWEDIALYRKDGRSFILIGDVGDNHAVRSQVRLYVVREPASATTTKVAVQQTVRVVYPDGPRDCESVGVDPATNTAWLVTKRDKPPHVYSVPLVPTDEVVVATKEGIVPHLPPPTVQDLKEDPRYGRFRSEPTALDLRPDEALLQTYKDAYLFPRTAAQGWGTVLSEVPQTIDTPQLAQTESATFTPDGKAFFITTEQAPAPLDEVDLPEKAK